MANQVTGKIKGKSMTLTIALEPRNVTPSGDINLCYLSFRDGTFADEAGRTFAVSLTAKTARSTAEHIFGDLSALPVKEKKAS